MRKIIRFWIDEDIKKLATKYDQRTAKAGATTGLRATGRWIGWLGRVSIITYLKRLGATIRVKRISEEIFLEIDDKLYQVKTATRRTMNDPQENWSALIELPNWEKWKEHESNLFFVYYYENIGVIWLIGIASRQLFKDKGKVYLKREKFGLMRAQQDLIAVELQDLQLIDDWLIDSGYKKTIKNLDKIKDNIRHIFKKHLLGIFKRKGSVYDYTYRQNLGMNPSEFKSEQKDSTTGRPQNLKAVIQYADMIRKELGEMDIPLDEIVPAGTIATFIKSNYHKDGIIIPELATPLHIDVKSYRKNLMNTILQLIEILGFTREDLYFGFSDNGKLVRQDKLI